jgi:formamidopyrimidine-DNA glycosylase
MPELPEVETTRRGVEPYLVGQKITEVIVRHRGLRQPVSESLEDIAGHEITSIVRRAKYLIVAVKGSGHLIIHLGMSGSLRISGAGEDFKKHDHIALQLQSGKQMRFHDPRRFGIFLHLPEGDPLQHPLLNDLGPEPFDPAFSTASLAKACAGKKIAIKVAIMDPKIVVGVGNIYASEALFRAKILPATPANGVSKAGLAKLVDGIRQVLTESIEQGGTTLRDFLNSDGEPGYFKQRLFVYDRKGQPCLVCRTPIEHSVMGQRSTYWCPKCQR